MSVYLAEVVGCMILSLFGSGVVANCTLKRSKGEAGGWIVIATGWGLAVAIAVYSVGRISGGHINPAVTVGLASIGAFPWAQVPGYVAAQFLGCFLGAILVWLVYLPHWKETTDPGTTLGVFSTAPAIRNFPANFLTELIGTATLIFCVLAIASNSQMLSQPGELNLSQVFDSGLKPLLVGFLVWGIGLSLGGPTGYAINPARDLGPRIAYALLPIPGKKGADWAYAWVPVAGPIAGGVLGAWLFQTVQL